MKNKWTKTFPQKAGNYWFYGYRYGKVSCGTPSKPEWMVVKVRKCANGLLFIDGNGQFLHAKEVEEAHFLPLDLPEFPTVSEPFTESCKRCHGRGELFSGEQCPDCLGERGR
jgi:hypothetical protein